MTARRPILLSFLLATILLLGSMSRLAHAAADNAASKNAPMATKHGAGLRVRAKAGKAVSSVAVTYAGMVVANACRCVKVQSRDSKSGPVYVQVCEGDGSNWM